MDHDAGIPDPPTSLPVLPPRLTVAGHELTLFLESGPLIDALVEDIRAARQRVWVEMYIFLNDAAGTRVAAALAERARAGVDVRILYDYIGSQTTPTAFFRALHQAGAQVHCFHSLWEAMYRFRFFRVLNRRNHRKLVVIDDTAAYFGGMNLVDKSSVAAAARAEQRAASAGWRDVHVRLRGPQQAEVADSFLRSWDRAHGRPVRPRTRAYRRALLATGAESIQFFDSGPGRKNTRAARVFTRLLNAARRSVLLSMAYFLPAGTVLGALLRARRRGVRIRAVVPGESDVPVVQAALRHLYRRLLRHRIRIYERQRYMLHSKVMVVDRQWSVIGSCNFDPRSLWINCEFLAVIHSRPLARILSSVIRYEMAHSHHVTGEDCRRRSWHRRLRDRLAWVLRWWL